jgi:hypothetical protein
MPSTNPPTNPPTGPAPPVHDERGAFVVIAASAYVAYHVPGLPARLARYTHGPDGSLTLHPVGGPFARLDLAVDAGRWRADRQAYAQAAPYVCRRCGTPLTQVDGVWVSIDYTTTAGGLSFCPPDPDATPVGDHLPVPRVRT